MYFEFYAKTHPGIVRKNNEDSYYMPAQAGREGLMIVADGMGGHSSGEVASALAEESFREAFYGEFRNEATFMRLTRSLKAANKAVHDKAQTRREFFNMGTTLVACYLYDDNAMILNVGDSRAYLINRDTCEQLTNDHSMVQELIEKGMLTKEEAETYPQKNVITRAVGVDNEVAGDITSRTLKPGDYILLCSDGLTDHVPMEKMSILFGGSSTMEQILDTMFEMALTLGGTDNITIVLAHCVGEENENK